MAIIDYYAADEPNYLTFLRDEIEVVMNHYSTFLHDGDYERWQPYTDSSKDRTPTEQDRKELARYSWVLNRFTTYGSKEWHNLHKIFESYV